MSDFGDELHEVINNTRDRVKENQERLDAEQQERAFAYRSDQERLEYYRSIAKRLTDNVLEPIVRQLNEELSDGRTNTDSQCWNSTLNLPGDKSISLQVNPNELGVEYSIVAREGELQLCCEKWGPISSEGFSEQEAQAWFEREALKICDTFGPKLFAESLLRGDLRRISQTTRA